MPAHNAASTLTQCVAAVRAAVPARTELVIVDDGSFDDTRTLAYELADRVVVLPCQSGAARARNEGIRVCSADVILLVDSDVIVNRDAVTGLLDALEGVDAAFGAYTPLPPPSARSLASNYKNHVHHVTHLTGGRRIATSFWSGFSVIRKDAFFHVGGFDNAVTRAADVEDIHLGYRLSAAGHRIAIAPSCQVEHLKRYTTRGLVSSDLFHRAIPWTRAMLELRTFRSDLNLAGSSLLGVAMFLAGCACAVAAPFTSPTLLLPLASGLVAGWLWTQRKLVRSCWRAGGPRLGIAAVFYGAAFCLYAPVGALLGVVAHALRPKNASIRNTVALAHRSASDATLALSIVLVSRVDDDPAQIAELTSRFPADARYEVVLVVDEATVASKSPPDHVRIVHTAAADGPRERCQRGLDAVGGRYSVFLEPGLRPTADWIDQALKATDRGFLVTGGSFGLVSKHTSGRAASLAWYWPWRATGAQRWIEDHPTMNTVFDTAALRQIGGLSDRASVYRRLSVFGARVVHFDPGLRCDVPDDFHFRTMRQRFGLSRAQAATMVSYYDNSVLLRAARVMLCAATAPITVLRMARRATLEGTADATFWRSLPRLVAWTALDAAGTIAGFCSHRRSAVRLLLEAADRSVDASPSTATLLADAARLPIP